MDLLVVRHAIAEDRDAFARTGRNDAERPLTPEGRRKFRRAARGLRQIVESVEVLATSSLTRAIETGELLGEAFGVEASARLPELAPDADPASLVPWLRRHRRRGVVAVVGHAPHLSQLIEYLLVGRSSGFVELKKGRRVPARPGHQPRAGTLEAPVAPDAGAAAAAGSLTSTASPATRRAASARE